MEARVRSLYTSSMYIISTVGLSPYISFTFELQLDNILRVLIIKSRVLKAIYFERGQNWPVVDVVVTDESRSTTTSLIISCVCF